MKRYVFFTIISWLLCTATGIAQTNTFPSSGNVGIGTMSPSKALEIFGTNNTLKIWKGSGTAPIEISSDGDGTHNNSAIQMESYGYGGTENLTFTIPNWGGNYFYRFGANGGRYNVVRITRSGGSGNGPNAGAGVFDVYTLNQEIGIRLNGNGNSYFNTGSLGIGTKTPTAKLAVNGTTKTKEIVVTDQSSEWPDYLFKETDNSDPKTSLGELEVYIQTHHHLPGIPTQKEVEQRGQNLGAIQIRLLAKIEKLTLHTIDQQKEIQSNQTKINRLVKQLKEQQEIIKRLRNQ
jgi:hypothetical protein